MFVIFVLIFYSSPCRPLCLRVSVAAFVLSSLFHARQYDHKQPTYGIVNGVMTRGSFLLTGMLLAMLAGCSTAPEDYPTKVAADRANKDKMFQSSSESPVKPEDREKYLPLSYFPVDEGYAVPAQLEPASQRMSLQMPTSTGTLRTMERVGELQFTLKGQPLKLSAFIDPTGPVTQLFVPFTDLTSGTETYPAGRYLDLEPTPTGIYIVDFNAAYHPYCYYNASYDCPFPPAENRLQTPIRAGERLPRAAASIP
jgi:uncharacterized protein (DUF1684 family)